jgi:rhodanese-related sulfurtransferase
MRSKLTIVAFIACTLWHQIALDAIATAAENDAPSQRGKLQVKSLDSHGPYCGIYSIIAAAGMFGIEVPVETLWQPDIVSDDNGSSAENMVNGLNRIGLEGTCHSSLSWLDLKLSTNPMILHYRSAIGGKIFDHWVTVLRVDSIRGFVLYDPPFPAEVSSLENVMANWDGFAIEVKKTHESSVSSLNWVLAAITVFVFLTIFFTVAEKYCGSTCRLWQRLAIMACALVVCVKLVDRTPLGFLRNSICVAAIQDRFFGSDFNEINLRDLLDFKNQGAILIDSRTASSYALGSIPGAINLPVNSSLQYRDEMLAEIEFDQLIVVFCQSRNCHYAERMARFLKFNGFKKIFIYKNGIAEWEKDIDGA